MNCVIVHGCPSNVEKAMNPATRTYDKHWIPWTKRELVSRGIATEAPLMPEPWKPRYGLYKKVIEKYEISGDTVLVGHSCGCTFLVRWLGETKRNIAKLILVAPWKVPEKDDATKKAFYEYPIDKMIASRVKEIIMFTADDEEEDGKRSLHMFHDTLGGRIINLGNRGHYTLGDMGTEEFPELIREIVR